MPVRLISSVRGMGVAVMREHVDVGLELLDALLVLDAEALLLVDDEQAEILELDVLGQQPVGADDARRPRRLQPVDHLAGPGPAVRNRDSTSTRTG